MSGLPNDTRRRMLQALGAAAAACVPPATAETPALSDARRSRAAEFLLEPGLVPLNTASLGSTPRAVYDAVARAWRALESSPVLMAYGRSGSTVLVDAEAVRAQAATFLGCGVDELLLTRCTTDGMNTVAQGMRWKAGDRVLTTDQEHHGGSLCWAYEAARRGAVIDTVAVAPDEGDADALVERFAQAMRPGTVAISVSHVTSTTGLLMPVARLAQLAHAHGALCIVDGAQAAGAMPVDVKALACDAYATSGHKWLLGPKGTGLLYVSRDATDRIAPIQWQDSRHYGAESAGVGPLPLVIGLGAALDRLQAIGLAQVQRHGLALRERARAGMAAIEGLRVVGPPEGPMRTAIVAAAVPDSYDSQALINALRDKHRVIVKMVEKHRFNGIRLSPHVYNDDGDIDAVLAALREELGQARAPAA